MKTKKISTIITLIFSLFSIISQGQNIDEIIKKHIDARGGQEKWDAVKSIKMMGQYTSFSDIKPFQMIVTAEGLYRFDFGMGQFNLSQGYDGEIAWMINPWWDFSHPYEALPAEVFNAEQRTEICSPFYKYKEKGYQVELLGNEDVEGVDCYKIKLIRADGKQETWFLNAETYLEVKSLGYGEDFGRLYPAEIFFDNFQEIEGLVIPFFRESSYIHRYRVLEYDKAEINIDIDNSIFEMPKFTEMQKLSNLVGDWNVVLKTMNRRGQWAKTDSVSCSLNFVKNTSFLRGEIKYSNFFTIPKEYNFTYNSSTDKYRLVIFNAFNSNIGVLEGNVTDTLYSFENTFIKYDSTFVLPAATKYEFLDFEKDAFLMQVAQSRDNGKSWQVAEKYYFTRKD